MNLLFSIGIAISGIVLGYFIGQQHTRGEYKDLTANLLNSGVLLLKVNDDGFPDKKGTWTGKPPELADELNKTWKGN